MDSLINLPSAMVFTEPRPCDLTADGLTNVIFLT